MRNTIFGNVDSLVYALLHTLWQGGLMVLLLWAFLRLIPARRAQLRYLMSIAALAAILFAGVLTWGWVEVSTTRNPSRTLAISSAAVSRFPGTTDETHESFVAEKSTVAVRMGGFREPLMVVPREWVFRLAIFWACGVVIFLARCVAAVFGAERLCKRACDVRDPHILAVAESIRSALRIKRHIRLLVAGYVNMPAVVGFLRPAVLLPASLISGLPPEYLRAVLAHEFSHIRRWDYLVNIGQMLVEALLFFNPFVWWISRQVRREREACCDVIASAHCQTPGLYLEAVLACARHAGFSGQEESMGSLPSAALAMGGSKEDGNKPLLDRVKRLLVPGYNAGIRVPWMTMAAIFVISGVVFFSMVKGAILAAEILTPRQRIERIEQLKTEFDLAALKERDIEVSGVVITEDGKSPAHTTISIDSQRPQHGWSMSQYAAHDGKFTARIQSGVVHLGAWAEGYPPVFAGPFRNDTDLKNLRLVLAKGFPAKIHVTDPTGNPLAGAKLTGQYSGPPGTSQFTIVTDAKGEAVVPAASASRAAFDVVKNGFQMEHREGLHLNAEKPIEWTMVPSHPLKGRVVTEENGAPVPNAKISLLNITGPYNISYSPQSLTVLATTNDAGEFTLDTLRDDSAYWFHIAAKERRPTVSSKVTVEDGPVEIRMGPLLSLKGRIVVPESASHKATLEIRCDQGVETGNHSQGVGQTLKAPIHDKVASFAFGNLYAGEIRLMVNGVEVKRLPRFHDSVDDLEVDGSVQPFVKPGDIPKRNVIIRFDVPKEAPPPAGSLEIRYLENGSGPGIQRVSILKSVSIENGEARVELPVPNELEFSPEGLIGYSIPARSNVKLEEGATPAEFNLRTTPAGSIYGEITESDGVPVRDLFLYVVDAEEAPDNRPPILNVKDHAGGNSGLVRQFIATPLPLGREYAVLGSRGPTYALGSTVRVDEKTPIQKVKIIVPEGVTLCGRVTDEDGNPVPPMEFELTYSTPWQQSFSTGGHWTQDDGKFAIPHVNVDVPGRYEIEFQTHSNYVPTSVVIDARRPSSNIRLRKGKMIAGTALNVETGLPMPGVEIYALSEAPMAVMPGAVSKYVACEAEARTDDQGRFRFSNLPEGKLRIGCRDANFADPWDHTIIQGGQSEPVLLKLKPIPAR